MFVPAAGSLAGLGCAFADFAAGAAAAAAVAAISADVVVVTTTAAAMPPAADAVGGLTAPLCS